MKKQYWISLGVVVLLGGGFWAWYFLADSDRSSATPDELAARALSSEKSETRRTAAMALSMVKDDPKALPLLRSVAKESGDPEVVVIALSTIAVKFSVGPDDLPLFFAAMDSPEQNVRQAAGAGLRGYFGNPLPDGLVYRAGDSKEERDRVKIALEKLAAKGKKINSGEQKKTK